MSIMKKMVKEFKSGLATATTMAKRGLTATMAKTALAMLLAVGAMPCFGEKVTIPVWPEGAPTENGLSVANENWSGDFLNQTASAELYVYPAQNPNGTAILMCPGGGYWGLAMNNEGHSMADWFNSMGITYAVLKYRMPNGHDEIPLADAEQAMRILRSHAAEWGINPKSVGVMGASAGGHLASTLATHYTSESTRPDFQILFYPVITMEQGVTHQGSRDFLIGQSPSDEMVKRYSNELQVTHSTPEAFIMVSADDDIVPLDNSLRYASSLSNNRIPFSLHIYPTGGHGWGFSNHFLYKPQWTAELEKWLQERIL